jgi:hypothetical protein
VTADSDAGAPRHQGWNPQGFVNHLAAGWQLGDPDAFIAHFRPLIHPDVTSLQPLSAPAIGIDALENQFRGLFQLLPGVTATVRSWGSAEPNVFVEFELRAPARRHPLLLHTCDRFTLHHGQIAERAVYFDTVILLRFLARNPPRWPAAMLAR